MEQAPNSLPSPLHKAVEAIKTAILQGQYEAAKDVNRTQLSLYFSIGKYISQNTRQGTWGTGALEAISAQLQRELPGLRGFSATQLKEMRSFYENWIMFDVNSSVMTDEFDRRTSSLWVWPPTVLRQKCPKSFAKRCPTSKI
ncbi:MAG: hypothetical protein IKR25_04780 [Muribaculaceae bacterium]|nr:hypothetical protein [Muribaculaceae bacterium]